MATARSTPTPPCASVRDWLVGLERFGIKLGLDNIAALLHASGHPHTRFRSVHVAGTNGKGSVLAILDAILQAAGYRTGRYTSPHLMSLNERFLLNSHLIPDAELDEGIAFFKGIAEAMDPSPTFFEVVTAIAFRWFAQQQLDLVLVEVGLGGRFDSTNVIRPEVAAITNIDFEHTRQLGNTLEKIAFEKAGIIKPRVPVVVAETRLGPRDIILERAKEQQAPVFLLGRDFHYRLRGDPFHQEIVYESKHFSVGPVPLALAGAYQGENAAAAIALAEYLSAVFPNVNARSISQGLAQARWPCRLEKVLDTPPVIIDVAHNRSGAEKLAAQLGESVVLMGVSSDKAADQMITVLGPKARDLILTQFSYHRSLPVDELCRAAGTRSYRRAETLPEAIQLGLELASSDMPLVITGSIFLAGEARTILIKEYGAPPLQF